MQAVINHINNLRSQIEEISGGFQIFELKLRLLAESHKSFKEQVYRFIEKYPGNKKQQRDEYWNCPLGCLINSIEPVFGDVLTPKEVEKIKKYKDLRNKMLHGDLIGFFKGLEIPLDGQQILSSSQRNQLSWNDRNEASKEKFLQQAIMRFEWNGATSKFRVLSNEVDVLLDKLLVKKN